MMATVRRHLLIGSLGMSLLAIGTVFAAGLGGIPRAMVPTAPGVGVGGDPQGEAVAAVKGGGENGPGGGGVRPHRHVR